MITFFRNTFSVLKGLHSNLQLQPEAKLLNLTIMYFAPACATQCLVSLCYTHTRSDIVLVTATNVRGVLLCMQVAQLSLTNPCNVLHHDKRQHF